MVWYCPTPFIFTAVFTACYATGYGTTLIPKVEALGADWVSLISLHTFALLSCFAVT